jgi:hypothetical protein
MFTARQLIESAFRMGGVKGVGETPTAPEASDALEMLNGILDNFSMEENFAPGIITKNVMSKSDGTIVISNDPSRIILSVTSANPTATCITAGPHGLNVGDELFFQGTSIIDGTHVVTGITSLTSFTFATTVSGNAYAGTFKKSSEPDSYLIDLAIDPPDHIQSITDGTVLLDEYPSDIFYSDKDTCGLTQGWYLETALDPYVTLYLDSQRTVNISYLQTGLRNISLDTNVDLWPGEGGMKECMKWRLASDLAMTNGYLDMAQQSMNRFSEVIAKYRNKHHRSQSLTLDWSAPGMANGRYNISVDEFR